MLSSLKRSDLYNFYIGGILLFYSKYTEMLEQDDIVLGEMALSKCYCCMLGKLSKRERG